MEGSENRAREARTRWGHTPEYRESARRTGRYGPSEWAELQAEQEAVEAGLAEALRAGEPPEGERAMELAEEARRHIDRWFYPCPPEMHVALAAMYVADPRFRAHYEERETGLADYLAAAVRANAARGRPERRA